jgi:dephospho-CoA kinase
MVVHPTIGESIPAARTSPAPVIGLVGGVGSGKSTLARWLAAQIQAGLIDADAIGHEALGDMQVREKLRTSFGDSVFNESGEVDRSRLAELVFGDSDRHRQGRQQLEAIVHPVIQQAIESQIRRHRANPDCPCILLDAAILYEAGWQNRCDHVIFVDAPVALRRQRTAARGWDADMHCRREASQMPLEEKQRLADFTVSNTGEIEQAGHSVLQILANLGVMKSSVRTQTSR